jgi:anhydro-N-acetylmuramic acid kinase
MVSELASGLGPGEEMEGWPDLLATLTEFTARTIGAAYRDWIVPRGVEEVFLTGGGARNPALVRAIGHQLHPLSVRPGEELGMDPDAREAAAFAVLAWAFLSGLPANVPEATGSSGPRILGSWTPGGTSPGVPARGVPESVLPTTRPKRGVGR